MYIQLVSVYFHYSQATTINTQKEIEKLNYWAREGRAQVCTSETIVQIKNILATSVDRVV